MKAMRNLLPRLLLGTLALTLATSRAYATAGPLAPPAMGKIVVAFLISDGAVVIDFAGPWSVFETVRGNHFTLYTVAESRRPVRASSGMQIIADYTLATAPAPNVIVIPAQSDASPAVLDWIRKRAAKADLTMSVCAGAFILAQSGLLDGKGATLYHTAYDRFAAAFPRVQVRRGARYVEEGSVATAGGLSSGIDLALRVVERYFGRPVAEETAYDLEYQGQGWLDASSNAVYAAAPAGGEQDPVCGMSVDPTRSFSSKYRGKSYYFCSEHEKAMFDEHPERHVR